MKRQQYIKSKINDSIIHKTLSETAYHIKTEFTNEYESTITNLKHMIQEIQENSV